MSTKKCLIFDMDGTLIDSSVAITEAINIMRAKDSLAPLDTKFIISAINTPNFDISGGFYGGKKLTKLIKEQFEEQFKLSYKAHARVYDEALKLLNICKEAGHYITLASNAPRVTLEAILDKNEILSHFDMVVGADQNIPQKPDPTMLNLIKEKFHPTRCLFFGDSQKDYMASLGADIPYIQTLWGFSDENIGAYNAKNCEEAFKLLMNLN